MTRHVTNTVRFIAVVRDGTGKVLPVAPSDLARVVEEEEAAGATVVGEFSVFHHAERAVRVALRRLRRCEVRKRKDATQATR
jgi:hypothetical protein